MGEKIVELFTDGACSGNPGPGGWGAILRWRGHDKELYGGEENTTNNRMEAIAVIKGLEELKIPSTVIVYTDSTYVQKGMTEWITKWKANDYKIKGGKFRTNHDLWRKLDSLNQSHTITWKWVKGHARHRENERAYELALQGINLLL